jgi:hypothetical protein
VIKITDKDIVLSIEKQKIDLTSILQYRKKSDLFFRFLETIAIKNSVQKHVTFKEASNEK